MTVADRQLIEWYYAQPGRGGSWGMAVGYLLKLAKGGTVTPKLERECKATLEQMRAERARSIAREAAR